MARTKMTDVLELHVITLLLRLDENEGILGRPSPALGQLPWLWGLKVRSGSPPPQ